MKQRKLARLDFKGSPRCQQAHASGLGERISRQYADAEWSSRTAVRQAARRGLIALALIISFLVFAPNSEAVAILTGPVFTPAAAAPLAGLLQLSTDVSCRISVLANDGTSVWQRDLYDFATNHSTPLLGFKPGRTNLIQVTVYDENQNACTAPQPLVFVTPPLPPGFPTSYVLTNVPSLMEPGYTLFRVQNQNTGVGYITIMDNAGEVVWYYTMSQSAFDVYQLANGNLFIPYNVNPFCELNMLGQTVSTWNAPPGYPIDIHDGLLTDHGTILYLSDVPETVPDFPSSVTVSNAPLETVVLQDNPVVEISATNSALLNTWSPLVMLDPTRLTYLTSYTPPVDNFHANAVLEDTNDNSIIVSLRNQNAVYKFNRNGQLKWILGPPANWSTTFLPYLLTPVGTPFEWNYGQHAPRLTPQGTLILYDDGNDRASPYDPPVPDQANYSRAVEYSIDETNQQVTQVWDTTQAAGDRFYTPVIGNVDWLPQTGHVQVTYGFITYLNGSPPSSHSAATMARIIEYTHDPVPQVVFDLCFFDPNNTSGSYLGYLIYRSYRIPDLYAHPANPVVNLSVTMAYSFPYLEFTADPARSYEVQASTDLVNWTTLGAAVQIEGTGQYEFYDVEESPSATCFYRVVTN